MAKTKRKCCECNNFFEKENMIEVGGKLYCKECGASKQKEVDDQKKLAAFLYELCDKEQDLMPFLMTQVKRLKTQYNFKSSGILATLKFLFTLSENPPVFKPEIGIEPLVIKNYYFAKKYYEEVFALARQSPMEIDQTLKAPVKEIHLNYNTMYESNNFFQERRKNLQYGPIIDLNTIPDEEEDIQHGT